MRRKFFNGIGRYDDHNTNANAGVRGGPSSLLSRLQIMWQEVWKQKSTIILRQTAFLLIAPLRFSMSAAERSAT